MPLTRSKEEILVTMMGVKFLMHDGKTEVACRASRELLRHRFGSSDRHSDGEMFKIHRGAIEKVASDKFDAGMLEPPPDARVVITETDMASPLSRKV
jgi:hypothetical protein